MSRSKAWVPDRQEIIWVNFNPQVPMLVLSPKVFNDKTSIVIGFPMSTATYNATNPFAIDNSRSAKEPSYIICNQPKSFDWRQRQASQHPWKRVSDGAFQAACVGLNDIIELLSP